MLYNFFPVIWEEVCIYLCLVCLSCCYFSPVIRGLELFIVFILFLSFLETVISFLPQICTVLK